MELKLLPNILIIVLFTVTDGQNVSQCYFCAGTGENSPCVEPKTYSNAAKCKTTGYRHNCTAPYNKMCAIETHLSMGKPFVQMRGCNDGKTFYFKAGSANTSMVDFKRLEDSKADNQTVCAWTGIYLACVTKCDSGDFCNGPQLDMQTCGTVMRESSPLLVGVFVSLYWLVQYLLSLRNEQCD